MKEQRLQSFEVINPLPVSFDEGIADFSAFTANAGTVAYDKFLDAVQPDVIHVHTLMGLHKSFYRQQREGEFVLYLLRMISFQFVRR